MPAFSNNRYAATLKQVDHPVSDRALGYRDFRLFLAARFLATIAVQMQSVAIGWQVYEKTGKPLDLGLIGLAQFLPFVVLVLPAGQVADRFERRLIIALCYVVEGICALLLIGYSVWGTASVWPVFAVLVLFGGARAFAMPTGQALTPNLVPRVAFPNAVAINSSSSHIATIIGPAVGGLLYIAGPVSVYAVVTVCLFLSVGIVSRVRLPKRIPSQQKGGLQDVMEGLVFVMSRPAILGAMSLDLFAVLFGGAVALLPAYASDILAVGPQGLGLLRTAPAIGAAAVAGLLAICPIGRRLGPWLFVSVGIFGVSIIAFGVSTSFILSLAALIVMGAADMISMYVRAMLVQLSTPDEIRGRVSAVSAVFVGASNELGEFESGITAAWFGIVRAVVIGGAVTVGVTLFWTRLFPSLAKMDRIPG